MAMSAILNGTPAVVGVAAITFLDHQKMSSFPTTQTSAFLPVPDVHILIERVAIGL